MGDLQVQIFHKTQACRDLLTRGAAEHLVKSATDDEWYGNRLADFNLWAAGLGASKTGHASLEYRLRDRLDVKEIIQGLLDDLYESLSTLKRNGGTSGKSQVELDSTLENLQLVVENGEASISRSPSPLEPLSPLSELSEDENQSQMAFSEFKRSVELTLDQLARLSVLIRKSGFRFRHQKADRMLDFQDLTDDLKVLRGDLNEIVLLHQGGPEMKLIDTLRRRLLQGMISSSVLIVIRAWFLAPARLTPIQERLIRANLRRRNRFIYAYNKAKDGPNQKSFQFPSINKIPRKQALDLEVLHR